MSEFRKGQRVRVTYEAEYMWPFRDGGHSLLSSTHEDCWVPDDATIEPVEDLRPGDVYRSADGKIVGYIGSGSNGLWTLIGTTDIVFTVFSAGAAITDDYVQRPLTLLVRDGQPVTS